MDDGLKQRLIGAIVLLALAVIVLPVVFDRDPIQPVDQASQVPPKTEIITITISEPEAPVAVDLAPEPDEMYIPDEIQVIELTPEPIALTEVGVPKSWVLQVSSFRDDERANTLRDKLLKSDYPAYTRQSKGLTRVYLGPKLDKSSLIHIKGVIDSKYRVDSILLAFKP